MIATKKSGSWIKSKFSKSRKVRSLSPGVVNKGSCGCCSPDFDGEPQPDCLTCLDNVNGIRVDISGDQDCTCHRFFTSIVPDCTAIQEHSNFNGSYGLTDLISSGSGFKTFKLILGTNTCHGGPQTDMYHELGCPRPLPCDSSIVDVTGYAGFYELFCTVGCVGGNITFTDFGASTWGCVVPSGPGVCLGASAGEVPNCGNTSIAWQDACNHGRAARSEVTVFDPAWCKAGGDDWESDCYTLTDNVHGYPINYPPYIVITYRFYLIF